MHTLRRRAVRRALRQLARALDHEEPHDRPHPRLQRAGVRRRQRQRAGLRLRRRALLRGRHHRRARLLRPCRRHRRHARLSPSPGPRQRPRPAAGSGAGARAAQASGVHTVVRRVEQAQITAAVAVGPQHRLLAAGVREQPAGAEVADQPGVLLGAPGSSSPRSRR